MKVSNTYTLFVNQMLGIVEYGTSDFALRIKKSPVGKIFDCNFEQLKFNLKVLSLVGGYMIIKSKR